MTSPHFASGSFHFPIRVYYEDTDAAGVVYYANYLKFVERARTEALRALGFHQQALMEGDGLGFVVSEAHIQYKSGARLDDMLMVETQLQKLGKVRMTMRQTIRREAQVLCTLSVEIAMVSRTGKPTAIPDAMRAALLEAMPPTGDTL